MKTFEKGLSKNFRKVLSNKGYAKHTPTLRKPKFRLTDAHGSVKIRQKTKRRACKACPIPCKRGFSLSVSSVISFQTKPEKHGKLITIEITV